MIESVSITGADLRVKLETQVGQPYDPEKVQHDVRYLWGLGRFEDVRAELNGGAVRFVVAPRRRYALHEVRFSPHSYGFQPKLEEGSLIDDYQARQVAANVEKQLRLQGYRTAHVTYEFTPAARREFDLRVKIDAGQSIEVRNLEFDGDLGMSPKELRKSLSALRTKRMIPGLWSIRPDYSPEAVDADIWRLQSLYLSKGYFDANVSAETPAIDGKKARVVVHVDAGPQFEVHGTDLATVCPCLMEQRREAERRGILDFTPTLEVERAGGGASAEVRTKVELGEPYTVRRIEFFGLHRYSDGAARRSFVLDEGAPLDQYLLRKSIARLAQTRLFEGLESRDIVIQRYEGAHLADVKIRLRERKPGSWSLSGPVGPFSIAGPIRAAISTRLPPWGQGLLELSTYTASAGLVAWQQPIIKALAVKKFVPIFSLSRGFLPGESWRSGFVIAPQAGWQGSLMATGAAQLQGRLLPAITPPRGLTPELTVGVEGGAHGVILCEEPKPKLGWLRTAGSIAVRLPGALAAF